MRVGNDIKVDFHIPDPERQTQLQIQKTQGTFENIQKETEKQAQRVQDNKEMSSEELKKLLEEIKRKFDMLNKYLRIDIDTGLNIPVAKIIEKDTNRVIRQIPPDYLLDLMKKIDQMLGILLQKEV